MTLPDIFSYVGWAAYLSAAATIVTFVTGILFFAVGQPFGTINDAASVFQMLFIVPVAVALYHFFRSNAPTLSLLATVVGVAGLFVAAVLQALLVFRVVKYEQTVGAVLTAGGAVGAWLLLTGYLALVSGLLPGALAWLSLAAGVGYVVLVVGFWLGGQGQPLFIAGSLVAVIGYSTWAIWLGRLFLSGAL